MDFDEEFTCDDPGFRNNRYAEAYGDYRGGYRGPTPRGPPPGMGFGPQPFLRGPPPGMFRGPPAIFGRGFPGGPARPVRPMEDSAVKYLIRCGVQRENLKGLPRDLLNLVRPEHCGLCGHSFESFSISRVHYLSKNHLKNQKKWLNNTAQTGPRSNQEAPIKARELYCELCDVQITSKVHADSHYAGKSHRAVVIGRKYPKNPVLLQPGMERRLQQLIRREKKCLRDMPEEEKNKLKESKTVQPELYCDICKTSVTCSEQMTAHMNGKRHLTREKQYILKQMRGDTSATDNDNGDGEEVKEEDKEDEGNGQGDGGEAEATGIAAAAAANEEWSEDWH